MIVLLSHSAGFNRDLSMRTSFAWCWLKLQLNDVSAVQCFRLNQTKARQAELIGSRVHPLDWQPFCSQSVLFMFQAHQRGDIVAPGELDSQH